MKLFHFIVKSTLIALIGLSFTALAFEGKVVGVSDGDTITVLDINKAQHKIRLAGIDAPEKGQEFGNSSKEFLSDLVYGKTVNVPDSKLDRYGRTVSRVFIGNTDASIEMIKAGMAWHFKKYELEQKLEDRLSYNAAEIKARNARLGLWSQGEAKRPEDFRSESKSVKTANNDADCPCGANNFCTGPRGGQYCINGSGKKKYASN